MQESLTVRLLFLFILCLSIIFSVSLSLFCQTYSLCQYRPKKKGREKGIKVELNVCETAIWSAHCRVKAPCVVQLLPITVTLHLFTPFKKSIRNSNLILYSHMWLLSLTLKKKGRVIIECDSHSSARGGAAWSSHDEEKTFFFQGTYASLCTIFIVFTEEHKREKKERIDMAEGHTLPHGGGAMKLMSTCTQLCPRKLWISLLLLLLLDESPFDAIDS